MASHGGCEWDQKPTPKKELLAWFNEVVIAGRMRDSVMRAAIIHMAVVTTALFATAVVSSPLSPYEWIRTSIGSVVEPSSWLYDVMSVGCVVLYCTEVAGKHCSVQPFVAETRSSILMAMIDPTIILSLLLHVGICSCLASVFIGLGLDRGASGQGKLVLPCREGTEIKCLDHRHLFLMQSAVFTGMLRWFTFHFRKGNLITFSPLRQRGFVILRQSLPRLVLDSALQVASNFRWFILYFIFIGSRLSTSFSEVLKLDSLSDKEQTLTSTLFSYVLLTWSYFTLNTATVVVLNIALKVTALGLAKTICFPIEGDYYLHEVLSSGRDTLLRFLAFQDFAFVAEADWHRRQEVFKLSIPGGHPRNWTQLSQAVLGRIADFTQQLQKTRQAGGTNAAPAQSLKLAETSQAANGGVRLRSLAHNAARRNEEPVVTSTQSGESATAFAKLVGKLREKMMQNPLLSTYPESGSRKLLSGCQDVIWAVEGVSHMVAASVEEDRCGVVQKDLSNILSTLLLLQEELEMFKMSTMTTWRHSLESREVQLCNELKTTVKSAIYRMCLAFGDNFCSVSVSPEHRAKMENFKSFLM